LILRTAPVDTSLLLRAGIRTFTTGFYGIVTATGLVGTLSTPEASTLSTM
jgi:hypothetical protein